MKNQKGFSLVELLVVVIIIAIIAAIAIPNLLASRRAGNEASAISSLRTIHSAQAVYQATLGGNVAYTTLAILGTNNLIDDVLGVATPTKSGYAFTSTLSATDPAGSLYCAEGHPVTATGLGATGTRRFGVSTDGVIYANPTATVACADGALTLTGASAIQ